MLHKSSQQDNLRPILYGESLFVTVLASPQRELLFFDAQWNKLSRVMKEINHEWDDVVEKSKVLSLLSKELHYEEYSRVRIHIEFQSPAWPLLRKLALDWQVKIYTFPIDFSLNQLPCKKVQPFVHVLDHRLILDCKVGSYGVESLNYLKKDFFPNFDDYLWINPDQTIRECATSNVFAVFKNGEWITPSLKDCYQGVTREHLIDWLKSKKVKVSEQNLSLNDLHHLDYLLFTNSIQILGLIECATFPRITSNIQEKIIQMRTDFYLDMLATTSRQL